MGIQPVSCLVTPERSWNLSVNSAPHMVFCYGHGCVDPLRDFQPHICRIPTSCDLTVHLIVGLAALLLDFTFVVVVPKIHPSASSDRNILRWA